METKRDQRGRAIVRVLTRVGKQNVALASARTRANVNTSTTQRRLGSNDS